MDEKKVVLKALEQVDKWYVHLAEINGETLLIVSKKPVPESLVVEGKEYKVKYYDPDQYIEAIKRDENEFRGYRVYYFIKLYIMRKVLEVLAQMKLERMCLGSGL